MEPYQEIEVRFAEFCHRQPEQIVACSSGTAALHLALEALELPLGSRVMLPEFTMIACPRAVAMAGLVPGPVDVGDDLLLDCNIAEQLWTPWFKTVMPVHIYGRRCDMERVVELAKSRNMSIVEDLAEAHGVDPHEETDAACWSFYRNKIIAGEEGGAIAFKNVKHAARARQLRSMGFTESHDFIHLPRGHNYRMGNLHAIAVLNSLTNVENNLWGRRNVEEWYDRNVPTQWKMPKRDVVWVYDLRIRDLRQDLQNRIVKYLNDAGVGARHGFKPVSEQPEFLWPYSKTLNAHRLSREVIYLPVSPSMSEKDVVHNCRMLAAACAEAEVTLP